MNKGNSITVFLLATLVSTGAWAVELWNGFTTEMNKEQVITRATALNANEPDWKPSLRMFNHPKSNRLFTDGHPEIESTLYYSFSSPSGNITSAGFFFSNGRLYAVYVLFQKTFFNDFFPVARNQYGQPTRSFIETVSADSPYKRTWYVWELSGIIIYSPSPRQYSNGQLERDSGQLFIYDRKAVESYEEARRKKATEGVKF